MRHESGVPLCRGHHDLFDSRRPEDHRKAKKLCGTCPLIQACLVNLKAVIAAPKHLGGTPEGTWAGRLIGGPMTDRGAARVAPAGYARRAQ